MRKLAIKIKIKDSVKVSKALHDSGRRFGSEYQQFDRVFMPRGYEQAYPDPSIAPQLIIRTNTIDGQVSHVMILKRPVDKHLTYFFQTQVMDYNQTAHIISNMGYELLTEVAKRRRKLVIGSVVIYMDNVDGLGWYLKLEKNLKNHDQATADELWKILESLEITEYEPAGRYSEIKKMRR